MFNPEAVAAVVKHTPTADEYACGCACSGAGSGSGAGDASDQTIQPSAN
ncbi:MAG: hypothetical protein ACYC46_07280 [Acidobacteriaceae bacterium]